MKTLLIFIFFTNHLFGLNEVKFHFSGDIYAITQSENYISFISKINSYEYNIYLLDKNGSLKFQKTVKEQPANIVICELYKKILMSFYNHAVYEQEAYTNILFDLDNGINADTLDLYTHLKLSLEGKFLYSSTHLHDHPSPIQIYNLETNEHFDIHSRNWSKVTSLRKNKLIILQQLSERNRKSTGGTWTQLGTNFKIYDLKKKNIILEKDLKDDNGYPLIISRDDKNSYSLNVDKSNNIFIFGSIKTRSSGKERQYKFLKLDENGNLKWSTNLQRRIWPARIEYLNDIQIVLKEQTLNKISGIFEIQNNSKLSDKKLIWSNEIPKSEKFIIGQLEFDLNNKTIIKSI